ncbi:hypothetical protein LAZ67_5001444 [Cordylochernes scorpioides]|uniref:Telomere-associated protein Rif1 N-terminal domain-containing protein n=1 Tax=Cordylochernes scorpioides TaxID=51811 RepID=A0ABY6KFN8_9ARAC|nr:hypothetical protein LAZ67_5001444 [Cordylochernes scorpioides]
MVELSELSYYRYCRITLAGDMRGSSITNGCSAKTKLTSDVALVGNWSGENKLRARAVGSCLKAILMTVVPSGTYLTDNPRPMSWLNILEAEKNVSKLIQIYQDIPSKGTAGWPKPADLAALIKRDLKKSSQELLGTILDCLLVLLTPSGFPEGLQYDLTQGFLTGLSVCLLVSKMNLPTPSDQVSSSCKFPVPAPHPNALCPAIVKLSPSEKPLRIKMLKCLGLITYTDEFVREHMVQFVGLMMDAISPPGASILKASQLLNRFDKLNCYRLLKEHTEVMIGEARHWIGIFATLLVEDSEGVQKLGNIWIRQYVNQLAPMADDLGSILSLRDEYLQKHLLEMIQIPGKELYTLRVWGTLITLLGKELHTNVQLVNLFLPVIQQGFTTLREEVYIESLASWNKLITNFSQQPNVIASARRLKLLLNPLLKESRTETMLKAKLTTWWHLVSSLGSALNGASFSMYSPMTLQREQLFLNGILDLKLAEYPLKMNLGKDAQNNQKKENPRTTLLELEQDTGISKTTIGRIVTKDLKLKKTPAKFIPRFLTNEQKLCRLATCENMLEMIRTDPEWKDKIITGDETWVYDYDPETKRQYAEWRGQGEPRPKKSRILKSRNKVLLGIVHHEYLPAGQTVIKEMYLDILRHLREAIRKKMPEKWPNGDWILHHNNARPHTAHLVTKILPQPPYSPDIAPNYFFLFPKLKAVLKGRHFDTRDDIIEKSLLALKSIPKELYKNCFDNLGKRWRWCVEARGDYFKKF